MESDLNGLLKTLCPRVFADVAAEKTVAPYVVWQALGGESLGFLDNTPGDKRQTLMQISVWAQSRMQSTLMSRQIEDAMRAFPDFTATPQGEPMSVHEPDTKLYGAVQRFLIWALR